ncbi:MAG: hypothetical protein R3B72_36345 [Polyangiaceae bacterium]
MKDFGTIVGSLAGLAAITLSVGCTEPPEGIARSQPANVTVKMDLFHKPLPEIALPNDLATRYDATSPTERRINASMIAPTSFESRLRELVDTLEGWGVMQSITIPFTGPIDVMALRERHDDVDYDTRDDAIYAVYLGPEPEHVGELHPLDIGQGNYPQVMERRDLYWKNDPRGDSMALLYEEAREDLNGNGVLDPGEDANGNGKLDPGEDLDSDGVLDPPEDTDADGLLDVPNYLPGMRPAATDLAGRADALMTFYEKSSNTVIARPLVPFREGATYAVVVTRRVLDAAGDPVGSPYAYVNHTAQTNALQPLVDHMPEGVNLHDIAFTWTFTTQTIRRGWQAVRDDLYADLGAAYPAVIDEIMPMRDASSFPGMKQPHLLYGEVWKPALQEIATTLLGESEGKFLEGLVDGAGYVDFYSVGRYTSPQLFPREKADGEWLPLHDQVWPVELTDLSAAARPETVHYSLSVPRKEVSVRGEGKPAPVVIIGHGYTGNRFDVMQFSSYFARHGLAVIGIDGPSHGIGISQGELTLAKALFTGMGLGGAADALLSDRAVDQNGDGSKDSGADFWTSYLFHTRDMVRQFALDYMQLIRVIRSFDGVNRWEHDVNGDGVNELAGDFDADGVLDISAESDIYVFGGSLGGIMAMVLGAVDPAVQAIAPVSGGGGYGDMGPRSTQGGVYQAFILRVMGPLFVGTTDPDTGEMLLETIVCDLNDDQTIPIGSLSGVSPWDTMVVENLDNGERRCGYVSPEGTVRASAASSRGDRLAIRFYKGPQLDPASEDCALLRDVPPFAEIESFGESFSFQAESFEAGDPLVALQEGLGMRRSHPDFRRLSGIAQMVLDPADPAALAPYLLKDPLRYEGTGETTGAHSLIITTMGDTAVPVSGGALVGRASGILPYLEADPRYGMPPNQVLIDTFTLEGVHNLKRYANSAGEGVHLDIENFSGGDDLYGTEVPRYAQPLHIGMTSKDPLGGVSAAIFPYNVPSGQHGFDMPGAMIDKAIAQCRDACTETEGDDPCGCNGVTTFDIGHFMVNMIGGYFRSRGEALSSDLCMSRDDCGDLPTAPPPARDVATLP